MLTFPAPSHLCTKEILSAQACYNRDIKRAVLYARASAARPGQALAEQAAAGGRGAVRARDRQGSRRVSTDGDVHKRYEISGRGFINQLGQTRSSAGIEDACENSG